MNVVGPKPNLQTVDAIYDLVWRVASTESDRTDGLDRKAATLATFASILTSLTATLGFGFVQEVSTWWAFALFVAALVAMAASVFQAVRALLPKEYVSLGMDYLETTPDVVRDLEGTRGHTGRGRPRSRHFDCERAPDERWQVGDVRRAFKLLLVGLVLICAEAATLAAREVF